MGRKKRETIEFRFYEVPQGQDCLALLGESWIRIYGIDEKYLHFHNLFEVGYCRNGSGDLVLDEEVRKYETAMLSMIPANYPHTTISLVPNFWEYIFFDSDQILAQIYPGNPTKQREAAEIIGKNADLVYEYQYPEMAEVIKRIMEEMRDKKPYYIETVQNLLKAFVLMLIRYQSQQEAAKKMNIEGEDDSAMMVIRPSLEYIDTHFAEAIKVSDLAAQCNLSEPHFRRIFATTINMSPIDYLNLVRIQNACKIMNKTDHSMEVVASECGFSTFSTFNRNFRKFLDTSPYQWKKNKDNYENKLLNYNINALKGW
ncbi:AraC family transcriptional regulator [Butyrivibrio sp. CB08]|uniref:helix-turn-helix domain-containing protein n=1 Tax=Butyrivibrio sp. CB08 TaxID=2364879 RepID=UPI000EA89E27|nr:AraC family transcriptional regulator [Butyrivibrio sp. CB08]RKM62376.1 AraC family transcriptional regulator [Butyrivibrio sp. CB08]